MGSEKPNPRWLPLFIGLAVITLPLPTHASIVDEFVCRAKPGQLQAVYVAAGQLNATPGFCTERVECTHLSEEMRNSVLKAYAEVHGQRVASLEAIPTDEKLELLNPLLAALDWHETTVSCKGEVDAATGKANCMKPDPCKADGLLSSMPAEFTATQPATPVAAPATRGAGAGSANP